MQVKSIHHHAGWFASYMDAPDGGNDSQGEALVRCQMLKIRQLQDLADAILGEIELCDSPKELTERQVLESIREMIQTLPDVEFVKGNFKWVG